METSTVPEMSLDFTDPDFNRYPYETLKTMREKAPVVYNPTIDYFMVGRYAEGRRVFVEDDTFGPDRKWTEDAFGGLFMLADDNPHHNETRAVWNPSFSRAAMHLRRDEIAEIVDALLAEAVAEMDAHGTFDAIPRIANMVPAVVIAGMLGIPKRDIPKFASCTEEITLIAESAAEGPTPRGEQMRAQGVEARQRMHAYVGEQLEIRRREKRDDDLIGEIAMSPVALERSEREIRTNVTGLVVAGHDTTPRLLAHMFVTLARHPKQREAIRDDRSLIPQAIEEIIRYDGVSSSGSRAARVDTELGGLGLRAGDKIIVLPTATNRDPRRWDDPDSFDIFREAKPHLAFGLGTHVCLGINLARVEAQVTLDRLLDLLPEWRIAQDELEYGTNFFTRGLKTLAISR
jgi:cytochrome P450